jgi:hypothetical protein
MIEKVKKREVLPYETNFFFNKSVLTNSAVQDFSVPLKNKVKEKFTGFTNFVGVPFKLFFLTRRSKVS